MLDTNTPEAQQETDDAARKRGRLRSPHHGHEEAARAPPARCPATTAATLGHMAELGWLGILVPEAYGGLGLGFRRDRGRLAGTRQGAHGRSDAARRVRRPRAAAWNERGAEAVAACRNSSKARLLPCTAWQEAQGGIDPKAIATRAEADGDDVLLTGSKRFVAGAAGAGGFVVSARSGGGYGLYWVTSDAPGVTRAARVARGRDPERRRRTAVGARERGQRGLRRGRRWPCRA